MEHREPPRMADAEGRTRDVVAEEGPRSRFASFIPAPTAQRPTVARLGIVALGGAVALVLVLLVGAQAVRSVFRWLHGQEIYQVKFRDITLDPPAPAWYRWGTKGFLDRVRADALEPESQPALDLDLRQLVLEFQRYHWVKRVHGATLAHPNRVVVRLVYREPVARLRYRESERGFRDIGEYALDGDGVVLPSDDIDRDAAAPLVGICLLSLPTDPKPGLVCRLGRVGDESSQANEGLLAASKLAAFLKPARIKAGGEIASSRYVAIHPTPRADLYVQCSGNLMFHWGKSPGEEVPGEPSAEAKWGMLLDWLKHHATPSGLRDWVKRYGTTAEGTIYLVFSKGRVVADPDLTREGTSAPGSGGSGAGMSH